MRSYYYPGLCPIPPWIIVTYGSNGVAKKLKSLDPVRFAEKHKLDPIRTSLLFSGSVTMFWHELCKALAHETDMSAMFFYNLSRRYSDNLSPTPTTSALALQAALFLYSEICIRLKFDEIQGVGRK